MMECTISRSALVRELKLALGTVEAKSTVPILSNVLIEADGDRAVLTTSDLDTFVQCSCSAVVKTAGAVAVPAKLLLDYVRLLPDRDISIKVGDNSWMSLVSGGSRARVVGMSRESFPNLPTPPEADLVAEIPWRALASMIGQTGFAISTEQSRFTLDGALLHMSGGTLKLVATDGHRLALAERSLSPEANAKMLLPRKAVRQLERLAQDEEAEAVVRVSRDSNHIFFAGEGRLFVTRELTGSFPDYERVIPREQPHCVVLDRAALQAAIERVAQFSDERSRAVRVMVKGSEFRLRSAVADVGESEEAIDIEYSGPSVEIGYNAGYLVEFLKVVGSERVTFHFADSMGAGEFRPGGESAGGYRYVVMPMRV